MILRCPALRQVLTSAEQAVERATTDLLLAAIEPETEAVRVRLR